MADDFGAPFAQAPEELDARLLISQTIDGPTLALDEGELTLGPFAATGGALSVHADLEYLQHWKAKEAVMGPVRSVYGLAPMQTLSFTQVRVDQTSVTDAVQTVIEQSIGSTTEESQFERRFSDAEQSVAHFQPRQIAFGSFLEDVFRAGVGAAGAVLDPFDTVQAAVDSFLGGDGGEGGLVEDLVATDSSISLSSSLLEDISEVVSRVERQSSSQVMEERSSSRTTTNEQRLAWTVTNPYRSRSLQIRIIPVFRHFQVVTVLQPIRVGLTFRPQVLPQTAKRVLAVAPDFVQSAVRDPRLVGLATEALEARGGETQAERQRPLDELDEHLEANQSLFARRAVPWALTRDREAVLGSLAEVLKRTTVSAQEGDNAARPGISRGLRWSRATALGDRVKVPLADPANVAKALEGDASAASLQAKLERLRDPDLLATKTHTRDAHVFMGLHVEAVAGESILEGITDNT